MCWQPHSAGKADVVYGPVLVDSAAENGRSQEERNELSAQALSDPAGRVEELSAGTVRT